MRCWRIAGGLGRPGILVLCVAAVAAIAVTGPASARSHAYNHRHYHFARRHRVPLRANDVAVSYRQGLRPWAWPDDWQQDRITDNDRVTEHRRVTANHRFAGNRWAENNWNSNWQSNGWRANWQSNSWTRRTAFGGDSQIGGMAAQQASAAGIPVSLVERVIKRESGGNPRAVSRGNYGLMQIRLGTARAMGYTGSASGLLDAQTNMTYAVRYLAGAYRAAGGNESRAVALYASGYYRVAKAQGFSPYGSSYGGTPYRVAFNSYRASGFGDRPAAWQTDEPYAGAPRWRTRRYWWHHPV